MRFVARHLSPAVRIARGGRRIPFFEASRTPVEVPAIDERDLDHGVAWGRLAGLPSLHGPVAGLDGALWRPVTGPDDGTPIPLARLADLLSGDVPAWAEASLQAFSRTPFLAARTRRDRQGYERTEHDRGLSPPGDAPPAECERERGRAALLRFVAEDLRVGREFAYRRVTPLARSSAGIYPIFHTEGIDPHDLLPVPIRADRHAEAKAFWSTWQVPIAAYPEPGWHPAGFCDDSDLRLLANAAPEAVLSWLDARRPAMPRPPSAEALVPWARRGMIGAVEGDEIEAALAAVASACADPAVIAATDSLEWGGTRRLGAYLREHALPRLADPGYAADAEALSDLAP